MFKSKLQKKSFTDDIKSFLFANLFYYKSIYYKITHKKLPYASFTPREKRVF